MSQSEGTRTPNLRIHAEWSTNFNYQGLTFAVQCIWLLTGDIDIFLSKVNISNLTVRGQQHSFWTHEWMFLWKCKRWGWQKMSRPEGTRTPKLQIHATCFNHLSYQGQTFAVPCIWILALVIAQIDPMSFQTSIPHRPLQVRCTLQWSLSSHQHVYVSYS